MRKEQLLILTGPAKNTGVPIEGEVTIGRNPDNTIQLDDLQVSRKHALVEQRGEATIVRDLGSGNGTFVANQRILEYRLSPGDVIQIGTQELRFEGEALEIPAPEMEGSSVRFRSEAAGRVEATNAENIYQTFFQAPQESASEEELRATQQRLQAVYAANQIITSERELSRLFEKVMEQIFNLVPAHNGVILLKEEGGDLITEYVRSGSTDEDVIISSTIVNQAFEQGEAVITYDAADDSRFDAGQSIVSQGISSAMCVPLTHQDSRLGVVYVDTRGTTNAFVGSDLELLVALAGASAVAIKNAQYVRWLEQAYEDTLVVLANSIELRDHYTVGHTWRVTNFSTAIGRELGWNETKLKEVQMGGVLHDVGKIAVDDAILRKPGRLTEEEYAKMKIHPERGAQLLQDVAFLQPLIPYCLYHHERYDGKGYPFGLAGEDIPIEGRLVAVADTFDAMTSNRPYRKGLDPEVALEELRKGRNTQFDATCVDALVQSYREGKIDSILQDYYKTSHMSIACPFCSTYIQLSENTKAGDEIECSVCHRHIMVKESNEAFFGELVPLSGPVSLTPSEE